jgi:type II secretory pathway pseudopilin PulG
MSIKLNYREKVILVVLLVLTIIIGGIMIFVRPKFEENNVKAQELEAKQQEQTTIQEKIDTLRTLQINILKAIGDIDAYQEIFYTEGKHYEMEQLLHGMADEAGLDITRVEFATTFEQIQDYLFTPTVGLLMYEMKVNADLYNTLPPELYNYMNGVQAVSNGTVAVGVTNYDVELDGVRTWPQLEGFLDTAADSKKSIYVTTVTTTDGAPEGTAKLNIKIYHIVPMDTEAVKKAEEEIAKAEELDWASIVADAEKPAETTPAETTAAAQ